MLKFLQVLFLFYLQICFSHFYELRQFIWCWDRGVTFNSWSLMIENAVWTTRALRRLLFCKREIVWVRVGFMAVWAINLVDHKWRHYFPNRLSCVVLSRLLSILFYLLPCYETPHILLNHCRSPGHFVFLAAFWYAWLVIDTQVPFWSTALFAVAQCVDLVTWVTTRLYRFKLRLYKESFIFVFQIRVDFSFLDRRLNRCFTFQLL